ncbi:MAG: hypothetical protein JOZ19_00635 [Rubrobacter sp.]|nr:hypothetical protein [Rubrobacter sp.]
MVEEVLGLSAEIVRRPQKLVLERQPASGLRSGPRRAKDRWAEADAAARLGNVAKALGSGAHLLLALSEQEDEQDYERLCATAEAFIYVAITRLMVKGD